MAKDPVQVDDGGSTRVKLILRGGGVGEMDRLLDVRTRNSPGKPYDGKEGSQQKVDHNGPDYGSLRITFIDSLGNPFTFTTPFQEVLIHSGDQRVHAEVLTAPPADVGDLLITVFADDCSPIVDAKQSKKKRRYVITNAPPIDQVFVTPPGGGAQVMVYQANPLVPATPAAETPILYTTIVLT